LRREGAIDAVLDPARFVPAPGQGTLALEARAEDAPVRRALARICDTETFCCLRAERALAGALQASCHTPIGAHAAPCDGGLRLRAWVGLPDGSAWISDELTGAAGDPEGLGREAAARMQLAGAGEILAAGESAPAPVR
jgi:hydroxymethylbilane synthase